MSNILTAEYRKVITARYLNKPCTTCGGKLVEGDYATTNDFTTWHSYCTRCANSQQAQIAGLVARIEALVAPLGDSVPVEIVQVVEQATPGIEAILAGDLSTFTATKALLMGVLTLSEHAVRQATATPDPLMDALRAIAATGDRDSGFAGSLVNGFNKFGSLTAGQRSAAERMIAERARKAQAQQAAIQPVPTVAFGLYRDDDGTIRRVYKTNRGRISARKYNGRVFRLEGSLGLRAIAAGITAGTTRLLSAAEASAFGRQMGRCFNCLSIGRPGKLSDCRSLAVGYGPDCAANNNWWYPTDDEAARILRGDLDLDSKLSQALAAGTTLPSAPDEHEQAAAAEAIEKGEPVVLPELDDADLYIDEDEDIDGAADAAIDDDYEAEQVSVGKAARDLMVCETVVGNGTITAINASATPGVIYVWLDGRSTALPADLVYNHGERVKVNAQVRTWHADDAGNIIDDAAVAAASVAAEATVVPVEASTAPAAPVATGVCLRCEEEPATHSFVCHDGEVFKVCASCRSALVRYRVCPFHGS